MQIVNKINELREQIKKWKQEGLTVGLVPTMGALHQGHLSLVRESLAKCDKTVVSIFVNPTQFGPNEDFGKYPRTLESDAKLLESESAEVVIFAPAVEEMYGAGYSTLQPFSYSTAVVPPFLYTDCLCGKSRPGHFDGVCTIVAKLFNIVAPDVAFFGEKDRQQLIIIKKMVEDLNFPLLVASCPIVRDEDGLALSSRNKYLSPEQKVEALALNKILHNIKICYNKGITDVGALTETAYAYLNESHSLDYLEFRDKNNLGEKAVADSETAVFIAVKIAGVRLIDNILLEAE